MTRSAAPENATPENAVTENAKKPYFPLFVDLSGKDILFVGGGSIAARRIRALLPFADRITVVAPEADAALRALAKPASREAGEPVASEDADAAAQTPECEVVTWQRRPFEPEDLEDRDMVFAVTDDRELNAQIAALCRAKGILVNVSSDKSLCDFYFPGIVRQGETVIGVSASGKDHGKARKVRERIQTILVENGSEG